MMHLLVLALLLAGCLKPENAAGPDPEAKKSNVVDENQRAGATSSTNWPTEEAVAPRPKIKAMLDSTLTLQFLDTGSNAVNRSGVVVLYRSGVIPAIDHPDSVAIPFANMSSFEITPHAVSRLATLRLDTVHFSVRVAADTLECLLLGFSYSAVDKRFLNSALPSLPNSSFPMTYRHYSYHGKPDSSLAGSGISQWGKDEWCFYIPGSPFFWKPVYGAELEIGPLPFGDFPVRLLRISKTDAGTDMNHLESYEVKIRPKVPDGPNQGATVHSFSLGAQLLSMDVPSSISIRSR